MMNKLIIACAVLTTVAFSGMASAVTVIDSFDEGFVFISDPAIGPFVPTSYEVGLDPSEVVGGNRFAQVTRVSGPNNAVAQTGIGNVAFSAGSQTTGFFVLGWGTDATGGLSAATALNLDLIADGFDAFLLSASTDVTGIGGTMTITVWSNVGGLAISDSYSRNFTGPADVFQTYSFPVEEFALVNLTDVDAIYLRIDAISPGADYTLDFLTTIPEPASMSLLALGAMALIRRRRPLA